MASRSTSPILLPLAKRLGGLLGVLRLGAGAALKRIRPMSAVNPTIEPQLELNTLGSAPLCVLPWIHTQIETTGTVQLCCLAHQEENLLGNVHQESILRIFQSDRMNAIRNQMQNGIWPDDCVSCKEREAQGLVSFRQSSNYDRPALFEKLVRGPVPKPAIRSLDLRINNVCNFKCRFCHGLASNRWFNEHNLVFPDRPLTEKYHGIDKLQTFWNDFDGELIHDLETIHLAGGEPLLIDAHYRLLEKLIAAGRTDVELRYDTNLSHLKFKHWDVIELWKQFPNLKVSMSLDGVGAKGEYIRDGLDYSKFVSNVERLRSEVPHARRGLHFVVCIFNVIDFPEHLRTIMENGFAEPGWLTLTFLSWPEYLSVRVLTPELKAKAARNLRQLLSSRIKMVPHLRTQVEGLVEFLKGEDLFGTYGREFADKTRILDQSRGRNAAALFPDLAPMLKAQPASLASLNR